ncbi:MAG TPA: FHA domain-containing protein [Herpetosiphonaceae bacterium]
MGQHSAFLVIEHAPGPAREIPLAVEPLVIGRAETCDVVLAGRLISRQHASIRFDGQAYVIEDLGSRNGTLVNGSLLSGAQALRSGDLIDCGGGSIRFVDNDATGIRPGSPQAPASGVWLDPATEDVWVDGRCLAPPLSSVQWALLRFLDERRDQLCSRAAIAAAVWPDAHDGISDEAIDALVKRVRARLGEAPGGQRYLSTIRGRGLILQGPEKPGRR